MTVEFVKAGELKDVLNDSNHIIQKSPPTQFLGKSVWYHINGLDEDKIIAGSRHIITSWSNEQLGDNQIAVYKDERGNILAWEPIVEKIIRDRRITELKQEGRTIYGITQGYVNGRKHHLDAYMPKGSTSASNEPGYTFWMEMIVNKTEEDDRKKRI